MIPGDLLSTFPHRQFHTLPGLLDSWAAPPNPNPNACMPMQGGSLYHFYYGLWYEGSKVTHKIDKNVFKWKISKQIAYKIIINRFWWLIEAVFDECAIRHARCFRRNCLTSVNYCSNCLVLSTSHCSIMNYHVFKGWYRRIVVFRTSRCNEILLWYHVIYCELTTDS